MSEDLELIWAYVRFSVPSPDGVEGKVRPAVILGGNDGALNVLRCTSKDKGGKGFPTYALKDWKAYGLKGPSYVDLLNIYVISESDVKSKGVGLTDEDAEGILKSISERSLGTIDVSKERENPSGKDEMLESLEGSDLQGIVKFLIEDENEAVDGYDKAIKAFNAASLPAPDREHIVSELQHIKEEELEHIRELEELLQYVPGSYVPSEQAEIAADAEDEASKEEAEGEEPSAPTHEVDGRGTGKEE